MIKRISKNVVDINEEMLFEIIQLHQKYFQFEAELIKKFIFQGDYIDIYLHEKNQKIVGTVVIRWLTIKNSKLAYIGSVVFDGDYQRSGLLTHFIGKIVFDGYYYYPLNKKYVFALATTPDAYAYFGKFTNSWPKINGSIKDPVQDIFKSFLESEFKDTYKEKDGVFFVTKIVKDGYQDNIKVDVFKKIENEYTHWFLNINQNYIKGEQILCGVAIDMINLKTFCNIFLKSKINRIKKIYKRFSNTYKALPYLMWASFGMMGAILVYWGLEFADFI